jgi:hypothetical protein
VCDDYAPHFERSGSEQRVTCASKRRTSRHHVVDHDDSLAAHRSLAHDELRATLAQLARRPCLRVVIDAAKRAHATNVQRARKS